MFIDEGIDLATWNVGFETTAEGSKDFGVASEEGFGGSELVYNGHEDFLLVLDAV